MQPDFAKLKPVGPQPNFSKLKPVTEQKGGDSLTQTSVGSLPGIKQATQVGVGIGAAIGKTGLNIGKALVNASQGISNLANRISGGVIPKANYAPVVNQIDTISENLYQKPFQKELNTVGGKVGTVVGNVAPFVATGGATAGLTNRAVSAVGNLGKFSAPARVAVGAGTEGLTNYLTGYLASGGDKRQALASAVTAGLFKAGTASTGELLGKTKMAENLLTKIFKTDKAEMSKQLAGSTEKTLAQEVLDRGIKGNTQQIADKLIKGQTQSEAALAKEFAKNGNPLITLSNPKAVVQYLTEKATLLRRSGAVNEAAGLEATIPAINSQGQITANNALALRRFLDGLRNEKSFLAPTEELAAQQAGLKEMADDIRGKINAIGGTGKIMKDYSFYIRALDKLNKYAVSTKNADALGFINSYLLGESIASTSPALAGVAIGRRLLATAKGRTQLAQFIKNLKKSSAGGSAARSAIGSIVGNQ